jgi:Uncharacterized protein conserved in bacteria, COG1322
MAALTLAGLLVGWLAASWRGAQQQAELLAEQRDVFSELSAARQQLVQSEHWREECELLNNELRSLQHINSSLEADLREVTTRLESTQLHAEEKLRQMHSSEQRLSEQFENLANRIFEQSNRRVDEQNRQSLNGPANAATRAARRFSPSGSGEALVRKRANDIRWRMKSAIYNS